MKRIKEIINALRVLSHTPSAVIKQSVANVIADARSNTNTAYVASEHDRVLVGNLLAAIIGIAEDMEKPAKGEEAKA